MPLQGAQSVLLYPLKVTQLQFVQRNRRADLTQGVIDVLLIKSDGGIRSRR